MSSAEAMRLTSRAKHPTGPFRDLATVAWKRARHWGRRVHAALRAATGRDPWVDQLLVGRMVSGDRPLRLRYVGRRSGLREMGVFLELPPGDESSVSPSAGHAHPPDITVRDVALAGSKARSRDLPVYSPYLTAWLGIAPTFDAQLASMPSESVRRRLRQAVRQGLTFRLGQAEDLGPFYDRFYRPFADRRFGSDAFVVPRTTMERRWRRRGTLLLVDRAGETVAGALLRRSWFSPGTLFWWKSGFAGEPEHSRLAEQNAALEAAVLHHAAAEGYARLAHGIVPARAADGVFVHKRRLGCDFEPIPGGPAYEISAGGEVWAALLTTRPLVMTRSGSLEAWFGWPAGHAGSAVARLAARMRDASCPSLEAVRVFGAPDAGARAAVLDAARQRAGVAAPQVVFEG